VVPVVLTWLGLKSLELSFFGEKFGGREEVEVCETDREKGLFGVDVSMV
jgi:hypothetical protein